MEPKLGQTIRDRVTGFTGIACIRIEMLNGNVQFCVYPKVDASGKYPEGMSLDVNVCEVVDEGLSEHVVPPDASLLNVPLGKSVADTLNGFTGVAVRRNIYMSGCVYYSVEGRASALGATAFTEEQHLPAQRIKVLPGKKSIDVTSLPTERRASGGPPAAIPRRT